MSNEHIDRELSGHGWRARLVADVSTAVQVNTGRDGSTTATTANSSGRIRQTTRRRSDMTKDVETPGLTNDELAAEGAEQLPDREQMSLVNANLAAPVNAAAALNVLSDGSTAYASATQTAPITQSN